LIEQGGITRPSINGSGSSAHHNDAGVIIYDRDGGARGHVPVSVGSSGTTPSVLATPLDPKQLYVLGTLEEGSCGRAALAAVSNPNKYAVGFPCGLVPWSATIRNGKLVYLSNDPPGVFEFQADPTGQSTQYYPPDPTANDVALKVPCSVGAAQFLVSPSGRLIYNCSTEVWYDEGGTEVYSGNEDIQAIADGDMVATTDGVMSLKDGVTVAVPEVSPLRVALHAHGNGFHMVVGGNATSDRLSLWSIDGAGTPTKLGDYPTPPAHVTGSATVSPLLTADDTLVESGLDSTSPTVDLIFRLRVDGTSEVIYTEATNPVVKLHISQLVVAP